MFNIFINDFFHFISESQVCNFADDTTIYSHGNTIDEVITKLENDVVRALKWFEINSLAPNAKKFQVMFLGTKSKTKLCLEINGKKCLTSESVKLLGITIDWKLQFNTHVKLLCKKANNKVSALMRLRKKLDFDQKLTLFNSFVSSQFGYSPLIWMFHGKTSHDLVNRVHRRALRALYNDFQSPYKDLLSKGNHLTIHEINLQKLITKVYKCISGDTPIFLSNYFKQVDTSPYELRIKNLLVLPPCSTTTYGTQSFKYRGSASWNSLPDSLKETTSFSVLKSNLTKTTIKCSCKICITQ